MSKADITVATMLRNPATKDRRIADQ